MADHTADDHNAIELCERGYSYPQHALRVYVGLPV